MPAHALVISYPDREGLIKTALKARDHSYSPYSKFRVGASLLGLNGKIYSGANVENASYGGTICAERTAFVKAISEGVRAFMALAVVTDVPSPISPCGICRQFIREFCSNSMPILLIPANYPQKSGEEGKHQVGTITEGGVLETTLGELLPESFGPEGLP